MQHTSLQAARFPATRRAIAGPTGDGRQSPRGSRAGFTMIEMLMVIGIIMFLVAISVSLLGNMANTAKIKSTQATIRKVDALLTRRMEAFERAIINQNNSTSGTPGYAQSWLSAAGGDRDVAMVVGRKALFRRHFPQRFSEMTSPLSPGGSHVSSTESAELLYYMLTQGESFGTEAVDSDAFLDSEIKDTDGDGLLEFVDAWGQPLRFYRWPTRLVRPAASGSESDPQSIDDQGNSDPSDDGYVNIITLSYGSNGEGAEILSRILPGTPWPASRQSGATFIDENSDPLSKDADDPLGVLYFSEAEDVENFESDWHTPSTWHRPLIVSMGADQILGLYEPNELTNFGRLAQPDYSHLDGLMDNITNQNLQAGGAN